jgi:hypothetical protein
MDNRKKSIYKELEIALKCKPYIENNKKNIIISFTKKFKNKKYKLICVKQRDINLTLFLADLIFFKAMGLKRYQLPYEYSFIGKFNQECLDKIHFINIEEIENGN